MSLQVEIIIRRTGNRVYQLPIPLKTREFTSKDQFQMKAILVPQTLSVSKRKTLIQVNTIFNNFFCSSKEWIWQEKALFNQRWQANFPRIPNRQFQKSSKWVTVNTRLVGSLPPISLWTEKAAWGCWDYAKEDIRRAFKVRSFYLPFIEIQDNGKSIQRGAGIYLICSRKWKSPENNCFRKRIIKSKDRGNNKEIVKINHQWNGSSITKNAGYGQRYGWKRRTLETA